MCGEQEESGSTLFSGEVVHEQQEETHTRFTLENQHRFTPSLPDNIRTEPKPRFTLIQGHLCYSSQVYCPVETQVSQKHLKTSKNGESSTSTCHIFRKEKKSCSHLLHYGKLVVSNYNEDVTVTGYPQKT